MSQNYKNTLNLPRTDFPMKANLAQREPELLKKWEETRVYQQIQKTRANSSISSVNNSNASAFSAIGTIPISP